MNSELTKAAQQAQAQPQPAEVSDETVFDTADEHSNASAGPVGQRSDYWMFEQAELLAFTRAILALRPQAVPMSRDDLKVLMSETCYVHATAQEKADFINGFRHAEAHHGITAQVGGEG